MQQAHPPVQPDSSSDRLCSHTGGPQKSDVIDTRSRSGDGGRLAALAEPWGVVQGQGEEGGVIGSLWRPGDGGCEVGEEERGERKGSYYILVMRN